MPDRRSRQASELAEVLGEEGLEKLIERCGGQRFRVHVQPRPNSELARRLGPALYNGLQSIYRGEIVEVPSPRQRRLDARDRRRDAGGRFTADAGERGRRVRSLRADGLTIAEIARREGVSARWIRALLSAEA